jgi:hypothetical protein
VKKSTPRKPPGHGRGRGTKKSMQLLVAAVTESYSLGNVNFSVGTICDIGCNIYLGAVWEHTMGVALGCVGLKLNSLFLP